MVVLFQQYLKIYALSPSFPLAGSVIGGFYWLFLWNFKEIKHQPLSMTQPIKISSSFFHWRNLWLRCFVDYSFGVSRKNMALLWYAVVSSPQCGKNTGFFSSFPLGGSHGQGILPVIPLELQGKKHQPFSITQPCFIYNYLKS